MQDRKSKILGFFIFIAMMTGIVYLLIRVSVEKKSERIEKIELTGSQLLSAKSYLDFADISEQPDTDTLTLAIIKTKIEKHPYIAKADVMFADETKVVVEITEKNVKALLMTDRDILFITEERELLRITQGTDLPALPIISNIKSLQDPEINEKIKNHEITAAFRIIDAARLTSEYIWQNLSEINFNSSVKFRNKDDIVLTFSGLKPIIIFGEGDEAKKMVYFDQLWKEIREGKLQIGSDDYLDLRYSNEIFSGRIDKQVY